jgi:Protein of unknown function (DUF3631)
VRFLQAHQAFLTPEAVALLDLSVRGPLAFDEFCSGWAAQFRDPSRFGAPLAETLFAIESLALPENSSILQKALDSLPPGYEVNRGFSTLHQSLHLWLIAQNTTGVMFPTLSSTLSPTSAVALSPSTAVHQSHSAPTSSNSSASACAAASSPPPPQEEGAGGRHPHSEVNEQENHSPVEPPQISPHSEIELQNLKIQFLARLPLIEYDRVRRAEAKRLHLRLATLDDAVERARVQEDDAQANAVYLPPVQPWPEVIIDGPALFDQIRERCLLYLYLPNGADIVLTLWPGHANAIAGFTRTPRLNITSIEPGCGKTTVLSFLAVLCPRVLRTDNLKTAVLFRIVDLFKPTLLLDELDSYLHLFPELRGLLNAGNSQGARVFRSEGQIVRSFKAFAATALAGIGPLAPTLRDRSIVISLPKAPPGALKARFDERKLETETILAQKLARWTQDNFDAIAACDPVMPPGAYNRLADNWRPIFALAQIIGGHWPQLTLDAFNHLAAPRGGDGSSPAQLTTPMGEDGSSPTKLTPDTSQLLSDLRAIFAQSTADRLFSSQLVAALRALPGSQARTNGSAITQNWLAAQLRPLGVRPKYIRRGHARGRGYILADLTALSLPQSASAPHSGTP